MVAATRSRCSRRVTAETPAIAADAITCVLLQYSSRITAVVGGRGRLLLVLHCGVALKRSGLSAKTSHSRCRYAFPSAGFQQSVL